MVPLALQVGDEITGSEFLVAGNDVASVAVVLFANSALMYQTTVSHITVQRPGPDWTVQPMTVTPYTIATNEAAYVAFLATGSGIQIGNVAVTITR